MGRHRDCLGAGIKRRPQATLLASLSMVGPITCSVSHSSDAHPQHTDTPTPTHRHTDTHTQTHMHTHTQIHTDTHTRTHQNIEPCVDGGLTKVSA
jgi:hypothetical protein